MNAMKFILASTLFGIVMVKSEAFSWYRIQEMFRFQSFQMYRIIGTAVIIGIVSVASIKKFRLKTTAGEKIKFIEKEKSISRYLFGGIVFGLGWALTGLCPGPMFVVLGYGYVSAIVVIISAVAETFFTV